MTDRAMNVWKLLRLAENEVLRRIAKQEVLDSRVVQDSLDNPKYYRQSRALFLRAVLKGIPARLIREE